MIHKLVALVLGLGLSLSACTPEDDDDRQAMFDADRTATELGREPEIPDDLNLVIASQPKCELTPPFFTVLVNGKVRFHYKDGIDANRLTAGYRGDKANLEVTIIDKTSGLAEYYSPKAIGPNTLYVFAVNDKTGLYQQCKMDFVAANVSAALITKRNRHHDSPTAGMYGGWGPHLRSFLYGSDGSKWFVHERPGPTVDVNPGLDFDRSDSLGWKRIASRDVSRQIQQNMAHITDGSTIYSYGVARDIPGNSAYLTECRFNMKSGEPGPCDALRVGNKLLTFEVTSNYVGAAIVPEGRLVWYVTTALQGFGNGKFSYLFFNGTDWKGPYITALGIYDALAYLTTKNIGNGIQLHAGEVEYAHGNLGPAVASSLRGQNYSAVVGFMNYRKGIPATYFKLKYRGSDVGATVKSEDVFYDPPSKRIHVLARLFPAPLTDRKDRNGQLLAECKNYQDLESQFLGKRLQDLSTSERGTLDAAGNSCIAAVKKNQKLLYGYAPGMLYGSATIDEVIKNKSVSVSPPSELSTAQISRFMSDPITKDLIALFSTGGLKNPRVTAYHFPLAEISQDLSFKDAKRTVFNLTGLVKGGISAINVPGSNYSAIAQPENMTDFAVVGGSYEYIDSKLRGDAEIYQILFP